MERRALKQCVHLPYVAFARQLWRALNDAQLLVSAADMQERRYPAQIGTRFAPHL